MKIMAYTLALLSLGSTQSAFAKPYIFPDEHCQLTVSDEWHEVTKPDELISVENANQDSLTITVTHANKPVDVVHSSLVADLKAGFDKRGFKSLKDGSFTFQKQPAVFDLATGGKLGFTFFLYVIYIADGNDILCFSMVADSDPSQDPQFKTLLDSFALTQETNTSPSSPSTSLQQTTNSPSDAK